MKIILILSLSLTFNVYAAPCFYNNITQVKRYVCYSGKRLTNTPQGYVWYGTRGCFLSRYPCCYHNASQFGRFRSAASARYAYNRCNDNYPYEWGDRF